MNFGQALEAMECGVRVRRPKWQEPFDWAIRIWTPVVDGADGPTVRCFLKDSHNGVAPWIPTHVDLLAGDWEVAE